jgi:hypothetical protein
VDLYRAWDVASRLCQLVIAAGICGALAQWRPGAYLMIAGLVSLVATHSAIALVEYRRVMARPWPSVPPLTDDDW